MAPLFGRRMRKGATTTAVAAAAVAALSASQAPSVTPAPSGGSQEATDADVPPGTPVSGNSPYYTDLPPLKTSGQPVDPSGDLPAGGQAEAGIPATVLAAYKQAEQTIAASDPGCHVPWQLLAAIGKVESGQARGGKVDAEGTTFSPILGPVLNGVGFANISDTDNGAYDGDTTHDRAVGPMQFIPSTWEIWGQDANGDGRKDPNNIYDAALAAGRYLCAGDRDLSDKEDLDKAILGYNHSRAYLRTVLSWFEYYKRGTHEVPDGTGVLPVEDKPDSGPVTPPTPVRTPTPAPPSSPAPKPKPKPDPAESGGTPSPKPTPEPKPTPKPTPPVTPEVKPSPKPTPTPTPTPTPAPVARIEDAGTGELTAMAGRAFAAQPTVRVKDTGGRTVAGHPVRFEIVGDTDARFTGGQNEVTVSTRADGTAVAPVIEAGEQTGTFTVRAITANKTATPVFADLTATVTPRAADALARTGDTPLTAAPGGEFADRIEVRATYQGELAAGVSVKAAVLTPAEEEPAEGQTPEEPAERKADEPAGDRTGDQTREPSGTPGDEAADQPAVSEKGPYFKDAEGKPVRTLTELTTDADGLLTLPKLFTDDTTGTFLLRLTAEGGATVTIELTVVTPPPADGDAA